MILAAGIVAVAFVVAAVFVDAGTLLIEIAAGFAASLAAFLIALAWERGRERQRGVEAEERDRALRETEIRRRLQPIQKELRANLASVQDLVCLFRQAAEDRQRETGMPERMVRLMHPQLLEGAWVANAARLTELIADYAFTGNLGFTYGRIEELRWRLRYRSDHFGEPQVDSLDDMTAPLVSELCDEITDLLDRVAAQMTKPSAQPLGLEHLSGSRLSVTVG